jgi:hypothetical protein
VLTVRPVSDDAKDTKKASDSGGNDRLLYAVSEMQGWRIGKWQIVVGPAAHVYPRHGGCPCCRVGLGRRS